MRRFHVESSHIPWRAGLGRVKDPTDLSVDSVIGSRIKRTCPNDTLVLAHLPLGNLRESGSMTMGQQAEGSVVVVAEPRTFQR